MSKSRTRSQKKILIIAGPNGAGKTTFARQFLPREANIKAFVNADLIASGLSPFAPETMAIQAGKLMLTQIFENVRVGNSFAFETTLSGLSYARHIPRWQAQGYHVKLIFLSLSSASLAVSRVKARKQQGGHDIPEDVVRRRFEAGLRNFHDIYKQTVDSWALYDNSAASLVLISSGERK
jgi:predicted ABC-type ATPase